MTQPFSDFWLVPGIPLCQGSHVDPIWTENEVGQIIGPRPPEILAPETPGMSHGTKIFGSKFFSYHPQMMLFYVFCGFVLPKMLKIEKNCLFLHDFFDFEHYLQNKSSKCIKYHHLRMIWENFWAKNFGPMGHSWGPWGQDLSRTPMKDFPNLKFWSNGVHTTALS